MDPIVNVTTNGIERLFDYGLAVTVLVLVLVAAGLLLRYVLQRCDVRFSESLQSHKELAEKVTQVVEKNTVVVSQVLENLRKN